MKRWLTNVAGVGEVCLEEVSLANESRQPCRFRLDAVDVLKHSGDGDKMRVFVQYWF